MFWSKLTEGSLVVGSGAYLGEMRLYLVPGVNVFGDAV